MDIISALMKLSLVAKRSAEHVITLTEQGALQAPMPVCCCIHSF